MTKDDFSRDLPASFLQCCGELKPLKYNIHYFCLTLDVADNERMKNVERLKQTLSNFEVVYGFHTMNEEKTAKLLRIAKSLEVKVDEKKFLQTNWLLGKISLWTSYIYILNKTKTFNPETTCVVILEDDSLFTSLHAKAAHKSCGILKLMQSVILRMGNNNAANLIDISKLGKLEKILMRSGIGGPLDLFTQFHGFVGVSTKKNKLVVKFNETKLCECFSSSINHYRISTVKLTVSLYGESRYLEVEVLDTGAPLVQRLISHEKNSLIHAQHRFLLDEWNLCVHGDEYGCEGVIMSSKTEIT